VNKLSGWTGEQIITLTLTRGLSRGFAKDTKEQKTFGQDEQDGQDEHEKILRRAGRRSPGDARRGSTRAIAGKRLDVKEQVLITPKAYHVLTPLQHLFIK
jgi:hypothetical protein